MKASRRFQQGEGSSRGLFRAVQLREGLLTALMPLVPRARAGRGAGGLHPGGGGEL